MTNAESLKASGLKATTPRLRILELFQKGTPRHLSAEEVYRLLTEQGFDIGLATVYRVLTQFEGVGILCRHHFEGDKSVFELNQGDHHDHLVCLDCGHIEEFCDESIESKQDEIAARYGFKIRSHAMCLYVSCQKQDCKHRLTES